MRSSRLKHRIDILHETTTADSMGGVTSFWEIYLSRWAEFKPRKQKEIDKTDKVENVTEVMIRTRYHAGITEDMRVRHRGNLYKIISLINVNNANKELEINVNRFITNEDERS